MRQAKQQANASSNETSEVTKNDKEMILKTAVQRFTDAGLGKIEIVDFNPEESKVKFRIWNNFFAEIGNGESTYCNCIASFVSGMYEQIMSIKLQKSKKPNAPQKATHTANGKWPRNDKKAQLVPCLIVLKLY